MPISLTSSIRSIPVPAFDARTLKGAGFGLLAAIAWSAYSVSSRAAVEAGFTAWDLTALRFIVAGVLLLPFVLRRGLATLGGVGWGRGLLLALGAGPLFSAVYTFGLSVTPFAHGPVISPSVVTLGSLGLAVLVLGERPDRLRLVGTGVVIAGLLLVAGDGGGLGGASVYDLLFLVSGLLWAAYTVLLRLWRVDPIAATAAVAVLSMLAVAPAYAVSAEPERLLAAPSSLLFHAAMQGVVAAVIAILAFSKAVAHLGAGTAGVFPSVVPVMAVVLGIPVLDEWPSVPQALGIALATAGLVLACGLFGRRRA